MSKASIPALVVQAITMVRRSAEHRPSRLRFYWTLISFYVATRMLAPLSNIRPQETEDSYHIEPLTNQIEDLLERQNLTHQDRQIFYTELLSDMCAEAFALQGRLEEEIDPQEQLLFQR
jgi:hypothetical protein